jgi:hypothetical protein
MDVLRLAFWRPSEPDEARLTLSSADPDEPKALQFILKLAHAPISEPQLFGELQLRFPRVTGEFRAAGLRAAMVDVLKDHGAE